MAASWSVGSAMSLVNDTPAWNSELTMTPASTTMSRWLPLARVPMASTSSTAAMEQANANSEMPSEPSPSRMATAAPNAAPCEAPRISGETSGFWNVPW